MKLEYEIPTRVFLGKDVLAENADLVTGLGSGALVVMDGSMDRSHTALEEVLYCLEAGGVSRTIYHQTNENAPGIAGLEAGAALAREAAVDFIIAVGSNATLEAAKAIALLCPQPIDTATLLVHAVPHKVPVVCVPTVFGGGSEVTPIVHVAQTGIDHLTRVSNRLLAPHMALLDANYCTGMSLRQIHDSILLTLATTIDAIASEKANSISDAVAIAALGTISDLTAILRDDKHEFTPHELEQLLLVSNQSGLAAALAGGSALEALASPLSYVSDLTAGQAFGLMIPPFVAWLKSRAPLVGDVILDSLYMSSMEALEEFLWDVVGPVSPLTSADIERAADSAASTPGIKTSVLSLDPAEIASCYDHLLADETDPEPQEAEPDQNA
jgi:alcohol dehydrogenase class IV